MAIVGGTIIFGTQIDMSGVQSAAKKIAAIFAGIKVFQAGSGSIGAFNENMRNIVATAARFNISMAAADKALTLAEISGMRLKDAVKRIGDAAKENTAEEIKNVELMMKWSVLGDDLVTIYEDLGGKLLNEIAPAFPNIVIAAQNLADTLSTYVLPVIGSIANGISNIGVILGAAADIATAAWDIGWSYLRRGYDETIAYVSDGWNSAADAMYEAFDRAANNVAVSWIKAQAAIAGAFVNSRLGDALLKPGQREKIDERTQFAINEESIRRAQTGKAALSQSEIDAIADREARAVIQEDATAGVQTSNADMKGKSDARLASRQAREKMSADSAQKRRDEFDAAVKGPAERINQAAREIWNGFASPRENPDKRASEYAKAALGGGDKSISKGAVFGTFSGMTAGQMGGGSMQENAQRQTGLLERISTGIMDVWKAISGNLGAVNTSAPRVDRGV